MEALAIVKEVAVIVLVASATVLCVVAIVGLIRLFPYLRRLVENLAGTTMSTSKIAGDLASVSSDVATNVRKTAASTAEASENLAKTTASTAKVAGDLAGVSTDIAVDVRRTTTAAAEASENLAKTTASTAKVAGDLASASADVTADVRRATIAAADASENLAGATASTAKIAGDMAGVSTDIAADMKKTTAATAEATENLAKGSKNILESSAYIRTALQLLELLGPAGRAANYANMGISKIPDLLRRIFRRG